MKNAKWKMIISHVQTQTCASFKLFAPKSTTKKRPMTSVVNKTAILTVSWIGSAELFKTAQLKFKE